MFLYVLRVGRSSSIKEDEEDCSSHLTAIQNLLQLNLLQVDEEIGYNLSNNSRVSVSVKQIIS